MTPTPEAIRKANEIVAKINATTNDDDDEGIIAQGLDEWAAKVWEESAVYCDQSGRPLMADEFRARAKARPLLARHVVVSAMTPALARLVKAAQNLLANEHGAASVQAICFNELRDAVDGVAQAGAEPQICTLPLHNLLWEDLQKARAAIREAEEMIADQQLSAYWLDLFDMWKQHPAVKAAFLSTKGDS